MLAAVPTLLAVLAGIALGLSGGGSFDRLLRWRPVAWQLAVAGLGLQLLFRVLPLSGTPAVVIDVFASVALIAFAVLNIRVAGMVVIVVGLSLNLLPTIIDNGTPVGAGALVSAGLVEQEDLDRVELEGPRHVARDDDSLTWLGDTLAIPTGQVVSLGDLILLVGAALTISALMRNRRIAGPRRAPARRSAPPRPRGSVSKRPATRPVSKRPATQRPPTQRPATQRRPTPRPPTQRTATKPPTAKQASNSRRQPAPGPVPEAEAPARARSRRGASDAPRISYEEAVAGLGEATPSSGRASRRRARGSDHGDEPEIDLRD